MLHKGGDTAQVMCAAVIPGDYGLITFISPHLDNHIPPLVTPRP